MNNHQYYRKVQFEQLNSNNSDNFYPARLKVKTVGSETKWMDITDNELAAIQEILTNQDLS